MELKAAVEKYLEVVKGFGSPMPLQEFGLPGNELEAMVSAWEEDYHLHRHFLLIPAAEKPGGDTPQTAYRISGMAYTAIVFHASVRHAFE